MTSHRLILRAGLAHQIAAGIWDFLPLGMRVKLKIEQIIRQEFDLRPYSIIHSLDLIRPIYRPLAAYGHLGREDLTQPRTTFDRAGEARRAIARAATTEWRVGRGMRWAVLCHLAQLDRDRSTVENHPLSGGVVDRGCVSSAEGEQLRFFVLS